MIGRLVDRDSMLCVSTLLAKALHAMSRVQRPSGKRSDAQTLGALCQSLGHGMANVLACRSSACGDKIAGYGTRRQSLLIRGLALQLRLDTTQELRIQLKYGNQVCFLERQVLSLSTVHSFSDSWMWPS